MSATSSCVGVPSFALYGAIVTACLQSVTSVPDAGTMAAAVLSSTRMVSAPVVAAMAFWISAHVATAFPVDATPGRK